MTLRDIYCTFSSGGYLFINVGGKSRGWQFVGKNIELEHSSFLLEHADCNVSWMYLNEYEGKEGLAVVLGDGGDES